MLTGYDDERMRLAAQQFGATDFILKPFRPNALLARLSVHLALPPQAVPPTTDAADGDLMHSGRVKVWSLHQDPVSTFVDGPQLINGREMMRICRSAERKP